MLDFAESLKDGRLFTQAHRLVNSGGLVALILEGRGSDLTGSQMRREALQGAIVLLTLVFGLPVLRSAVLRRHDCLGDTTRGSTRGRRENLRQNSLSPRGLIF
jgi:hypothetical protein